MAARTSSRYGLAISVTSIFTAGGRSPFVAMVLGGWVCGWCTYAASRAWGGMGGVSGVNQGRKGESGRRLEHHDKGVVIVPVPLRLPCPCGGGARQHLWRGRGGAPRCENCRKLLQGEEQKGGARFSLGVARRAKAQGHAGQGHAQRQARGQPGRVPNGRVAAQQPPQLSPPTACGTTRLFVGIRSNFELPAGWASLASHLPRNKRMQRQQRHRSRSCLCLFAPLPMCTASHAPPPSNRPPHPSEPRPPATLLMHPTHAPTHSPF